jgi:PST family polysaccharide transporter
MTGLNYIIPAALLPYLVRVLGVEQYGLIAFAQSISQYFITATDYGFNFSATRAIAQNRDDPEKISRIFWSVTVIKLSLVVAGAFVMALFLLLVPRMRVAMAVYAATYLGVFGNAIFPTWIFQGMERMSSISVITGSAKLVAAAFVVLFVHSQKDTVLAALLLASGYFFAGLLGTFFALRHHIDRVILPSRADIYTALHEGRHLFLTTAAISLYSNTNTFLVGLIGGNVQAGYFSLADKVIRAITGAFAPLIQAAYPRMIRLAIESRELALAFVRKILAWSICIALGSGIALFLLANFLADIAFGHSAAAVVPLLQSLSLFPLLAAVTYIISALVLMPFGFDGAQSRLLLGVGVLNVCIGFILITRLGALGGVIGMSIVEAVQLGGGLWLLASHGVFLFGPSRKIGLAGR